MPNTSHANLQPEILQVLTNMLHDINPFINIYKTAKERLDQQTRLHPGEEVQVLLNPQLHLILEVGADRRCYNLPTADEVAMILPSEYSNTSFRDIVLTKRTSHGEEEFSFINPNHAGYMPLHYVLLFPHGELGWHWALKLHDPNSQREITQLSQCEFYRYQLHLCPTESPVLFLSQRLFQQYLVDAWASCDQNKLS